MNYLFLMPKIFGLMQAAETLGGPGTGPEKKEAVKQGVKMITSGMVEASGGGQKETWRQLDGAIDILARLL